MDDLHRREASEVLSAIDDYYRDEVLHATEKKNNDATIDLPSPSPQVHPQETQGDAKKVDASELTLPHQSDPTARDVTLEHVLAIDPSFDFSVGDKKSPQLESGTQRTKLPKIPGYQIKGVLGRGGMELSTLLGRRVSIVTLLSKWCCRGIFKPARASSLSSRGTSSR